MMLVRPSIPERLARLQRMRDALEGLALTAQAQKRLALEIQHLLFRERRRMREIAAGEDPRELSADERVVVADSPGAPGEVNAKLQRGEHPFATDAEGGARLRGPVALRDRKRLGLGVRDQAVAVHRDSVAASQEAQRARV